VRAHPTDPKTETDIVRNSIAPHMGVLEHGGRAPAKGLFGGFTLKTAESYLACGRLDQHRESAQEGCLAGSVRTQDGKHLALSERQMLQIQHRLLAVLHPESLRRQDLALPGSNRRCHDDRGLRTDPRPISSRSTFT
jgi:hypothetical protein